MNLIAYLFAFLAGALITCQTGSNTQLKKSLGQPLPALIVNYIVGFAAIGIYALAKRVPSPPHPTLLRRRGGGGLEVSLEQHMVLLPFSSQAKWARRRSLPSLSPDSSSPQLQSIILVGSGLTRIRRVGRELPDAYSWGLD
jgi:hypothetical protein